jgi:imidazoleglycerol-phosphate dehydratase
MEAFDMRTAQIRRETKETQISLSLNLDGTGTYQINTGVGFFDHMLTHIAKHGMLDLVVEAKGDLEVDAHHTVEDIGIVFGQALVKAAGDKTGMVRFGTGLAPLDEALVMVVMDFGGRSHLEWGLSLPTAKVGDFDTELAREFFLAVASNAGMALHLVQQSGVNSHHILESAFKSFGRALDQATMLDPRRTDVPSTKGTL